MLLPLHIVERRSTGRIYQFKYFTNTSFEEERTIKKNLTQEPADEYDYDYDDNNSYANTYYSDFYWNAGQRL